MLKILSFVILLSSFLFSQDSTTIALQLANKYQFQSAGYIIAKEKGFYKARGLDVDLKEYDLNVSVEEEVLNGDVQFGVSDDSVIQQRIAEQKPFFLLFALCQEKSEKNIYDNILFTTEDFFNNNARTVDAFYKATVLGWKYAFNHIDETIEIIEKKYNTQNLTKEKLKLEAKELRKLAFGQQAKFGNINPQKIENFVKSLKLQNLKEEQTPDYSSYIYEQPKKDKIRFYPNEKRYIETHPTVYVGVLANYYPFDIIDLQGKHIGLFHDILDIISKYTKLNVEFKYFKNVPTLVRMLEKKDVDIVGVIPKISGASISYTPSFAKIHEYLFINDKNIKKELKNIGIFGHSLEKIDNKKKLIKSLYHMADIKIYEDIKHAIKELQNKKLDVLYAPESLMLNYIEKNYLKNINFSYPKQSLPEEYLFAGTLSTNNVLKKIITKAINSITLEETYQLQIKWTPLPIVKKKRDWTLVVQIFILIIIIAIMIAYKQVSMAKTNKKLKSQEKKLLRTQQILLEQVQKDPLTKLYNRRYFADVSKDILSISKREKSAICVIMADIDNFKAVNDTYGHLAGDKVLKEISKRLRDISRESDIIARYGGEEFIILIPNTELDGAQQFAEKIRATVAYPPFKINDKISIRVTISIGLTHMHVEEDSTMDNIFIRADKALYEAKNSGKNRVFVML